MPDAATLAVLKDVVCIALLASVVGAGAYALMRSVVPVAAWDHGTHSAAPRYGRPDAVLALLLVLLLTSGVFSSETSSADSASKTVEKVSEVAQLGSVASTVMMDLMLVALVVGYLRLLRDREPAELFGLRRMTVKAALLKALFWLLPTMVIVWAVSFGASAMLENVWPDQGPQSAVEMLEKTHSPLVRLALSFTAVVVAPLAEEILFRGFLFGVLKRYTDAWFAGLISALLFAAVHMHVGFFLPLFALGLVFVMVYERTGCLLVCMFLHAMFNGLQEGLMLFGDK